MKFAQIYGWLYWPKYCLNSGVTTFNPDDTATKVADELRVSATKLKGSFMDEEGTAVDYE